MNFISMSGAYSIDRAFRIKDFDWFDDELPSEFDLAILDGKVKDQDPGFHADIMLAHDAPVNLYQHKGDMRRVIRAAEAEYSQMMHHNAVMKYTPHLYVHGHWHMHYRYYYGTTQCVALDQSSTYENLTHTMILDTDTRTLDLPHRDLRTIFELPHESETNDDEN
jgi:hypothetical protein